jgi:hypothetical protein
MRIPPAAADWKSGSPVSQGGPHNRPQATAARLMWHEILKTTGPSWYPKLLRFSGKPLSGKGNVHFGIATGCRRIHSNANAVQILADARPSRRARQYHESDSPAGEILLVTNPLVGGEQDIH